MAGTTLPACLTPLPVAFQDSCVSPEGSLSLLKCVRLALTVQVVEAADGRRRFSAHLETSARRDLSDRCPARQGPTRICPDRCQSVSALLCVFMLEECTTIMQLKQSSVMLFLGDCALGIGFNQAAEWRTLQKH